MDITRLPQRRRRKRKEEQHLLPPVFPESFPLPPSLPADKRCLVPRPGPQEATMPCSICGLANFTNMVSMELDTAEAACLGPALLLLKWTVLSTVQRVQGGQDGQAMKEVFPPLLAALTLALKPPKVTWDPFLRAVLRFSLRLGSAGEAPLTLLTQAQYNLSFSLHKFGFLRED